MKTHLKIAICTLAEEIRIIKRQERHWQFDHPLRHGLQLHREGLHSEARAQLLAYGFLRGRDYLNIERTCCFPPDWQRVEYYVKRFGDGYVKGRKIDVERDVMQRWQGWLEHAKENTTKELCKAYREHRQVRGTNRRVRYKARFWRPEPSDQAALRASLKARWQNQGAVQPPTA